jgi:hypothetical protein
MPSHAHETVPGERSTVGSREQPWSRVASTDQRDTTGPAERRRACAALVQAYGGNTHQLLIDVADLLEASVAYVDRPTIEAHLEREMSDADWSSVAAQLTAMAFDEHIGDAGTTRTDWIDDVLLRAGVPAWGRSDSRPSRSPGHRTRP